MKNLKKIILPVAGLGTRFLPASKSVPKEMFPIVDKPLIHFAVEEAVLSGFKEIIFVINNFKQSIIDYFDTSSNSSKELLKKNKSYIKHINKIAKKMLNFILYIKKDLKVLDMLYYKLKILLKKNHLR